MLAAKAESIAIETGFIPGKNDVADFLAADADNKSRLSKEEVETCRQKAARMSASDFIDLISTESS